MLDDNDHRRLAQRLDLFHFREEAPGMVFWHPRGFLLYRLLEGAVRRQFSAQGYAEVRTPQLLRRPVWEASGHYRHFRDGMLAIAAKGDALDAASVVEHGGDRGPGETFVKPVSCPGHVFLAEHRSLSYRDLPLRLAEFGIVHRDEPSGSLHGLLRLRQFTQDDGHVFCTEDQAVGEAERFCRSVGPFYEAFGFSSVQVSLATRPEDRAGDDAAWDLAEATLARVVERLGWQAAKAPGGGAFYGPKLEFSLCDRFGRAWQMGTIQLDLVMPERFGLRYVGSDGARRHPVMLHRALYGSLERFMGILLEHHGAELPAWLCPEQVRVLPVAEEHAEAAERACDDLLNARLRARVDASGESLAHRVAEAHQAGVPFVAVVGDRELQGGSLAVRARRARYSLPLGEAVARLAGECQNPFEGLAPGSGAPASRVAGAFASA